MYSNLIASLSKPLIYTKTKGAFWDEEYISKQMLKAHLDPDFDAASRKFAFIKKSAEWIKDIVTPSEYPELLDLGCGPGIYAEEFTHKGYQVTGIDFSSRSINYAKQSASDKKLDITYLYESYLEMDLKRKFDFATMIFCDYGALSTEDRKILMDKIHQHLKPGGKLLLDVFSMVKYDNYQESQTWNVSQKDGFWRADEYVELNAFQKYSENVTLRQVAVISKNELTPYYIWDTYFTIESLTREVESSGFKVCQVFGDVAGSEYQKESETIAILLEKL